MDGTALILVVALAALAGFLSGFLLARLRGGAADGEERAARVENAVAALDRTLRDEFARSRGEASEEARRGRGELTVQTERVARSVEERLDTVRSAVERRLGEMIADNAAQLDRIRGTVDERLQGTLEARLAESFRSVSERLERVHAGLGEMRTLASDVGDLKRVLSNVKSRGTWGEVQLSALVSEILVPAQYEENVAVEPGSRERVELAIRLPGHEPGEAPVLLPVDAKFPVEDYARLREAEERGDGAAAEAAGKALLLAVKSNARTIAEKYLKPPRTTDFGVMYLPSEGLYAEVARRPGTIEALQREHRVVVAGPSTFAALLNSLQVGFRTVAIRERTAEVMRLLGAVKADFGRFADALDGVRKRLEQAQAAVEEASRRSRTVERRLRGVEEAPGGAPGSAEGRADGDGGAEGEG